MKIFKNKKRIMTIILPILLILIDRLRVYGKNFIKDKNIMDFILVVEIVLAVIIVWLFTSFLKKTLKSFLRNNKNLLGKFLQRLFRPVLVKIREVRERRKRFIKGSDENKFIWNFNKSKKRRKISKSQEKINLKACRSNSEKIRLLYIKNILQLLKKGRHISYSRTPKEIKNSLDFRESDVLFDVYEQVRYREDAAVSDDAVKLCGEAAERK